MYSAGQTSIGSTDHLPIIRPEVQLSTVPPTVPLLTLNKGPLVPQPE
jgi:hypothetical protein